MASDESFGDLHGEKLLWDTPLLQPELGTARFEYEYHKLHFRSLCVEIIIGVNV
jgi:hypothetical protein